MGLATLVFAMVGITLLVSVFLFNGILNSRDRELECFNLGGIYLESNSRSVCLNPSMVLDRDKIRK